MKKVSLSDLARELNVSKTLVSLVLNDKGSQYGTNKDVQIKVKAKAVEMGYQPNQTARSLRSGKTYNIAFLTSDLSNPFTANFCKNLELLASQKGLNLILRSGAQINDKSNFEALINNVDGLIIHSTDSNFAFEPFLNRNLPLVQLEGKRWSEGVSYLGIDFEKMVETSALSMLKNGLEYIPLLVDKNQGPNVLKQMLKGAQNALKKYKKPSDAILLLNADSTNVDTTTKAINAFVKEYPDVKGVLCSSNELALQALNSIKEFASNTADSWMIMSLYDHEFFNYTSPKISSYSIPYAEMAKATMDLLQQQMEQKSTQAKSVTIDPSLLNRSIF